MGPQNFWQFLLIVFNWFESKTTRILQIVQGLMALALTQCFDADGHLVAHSIIPARYIGWAMFAVAALTYLRAQYASNTLDVAKTLVAASKSTEVPLSQTIQESKS